MLSYITGSSSTLVLFLVGVLMQSKINRMLEIVQHEFWYVKCRGIDDDVYRKPAAEVLYTKFVRKYAYVFTAASASMCLTPIIWVAQYRDLNSPAALIFRMWTPWPQLTSVKYTVVYTIQVVVSSSALSNIAGLVLAMMVFVTEMQVQVDMLINTVDRMDVENAHLTRDRAQQARDELVRCVKHHQTLIT